MIKITTCLSLSFVLALNGCGKAKTLSSNYQDKTVYFTHGTPLNLLNGSTANTLGLFPSASYLEYDNFHLMSAASFVEKSRQSTVASIEDVEEENRTDSTGGSSGGVVPIYNFHDAGNGVLLWGAPNSIRSPVFAFDSTGASLKLTSINDQAVEVLHYSVRDDQKAFSILVKHSQSGSGTVITSYVFGSIVERNSPVYSSGDYQYLNGSEKIAWDAIPDVHLCASGSAALQTTVRKSVESWHSDPAAGNDTWPVQYSAPASYPPFSDLNFHCIYVVNSFDLSDSPVAKTLGVTLASINIASRRIIDSDVFLFADLIADELETGETSPVTMHEMGHFWGLGHDFRSNSDGSARHETIMGYSQGKDFITAWDYEAIQDLYSKAFSIPL